MMHNIFKIMDDVINFDTAQAHCDIPCGIYDPAAAQLAALSCVRYMDLINEIDDTQSLKLLDYTKASRLIAEKESALIELKEAIRVIWGDYFKEAQFKQIPNAHELTHSIMTQASKCKQTHDRKEGEILVSLVNKFTTAFWLTKDISTFKAICPYQPKLEVVYPDLKN